MRVRFNGGFMEDGMRGGSMRDGSVREDAPRALEPVEDALSCCTPPSFPSPGRFTGIIPTPCHRRASHG